MKGMAPNDKKPPQAGKPISAGKSAEAGKPVEIKLEESPSAKAAQAAVDPGKKFIAVLIVALSLIFVTGLVWFFGFSPASPIGAGWFLFSFAAGLSMIVLPCTLPLAFVIVPLSMGKGIKKGLSIAFAFSLGVAITLSLYGVLAAIVGEIAIGTLGAPLETVKNWLYFVAGIATYLFALGELGLINVRMPTYSGAHPGFIQRQGDVFKALLLGMFLGNIGVGCPHPATPLILTRIAASGDIFYGWLLFFVHALGRVLPLILLAVLGILGINALSWVVSRKDRIERATGWAMVFVAGFILVLGLFTHDWWVASGSHSLFESVTQEEKFLGVISGRLGVSNPHQHGLSEIESGTGLFGLPLGLGNWVLVFLWVLPLFWYWSKKRRAVALEALPGIRLLFWFFTTFALLLALIFIYTIPHWFLQHKALEAGDEVLPVSVDVMPLSPLVSNKAVQLEIQIKDKGARALGEVLEYSHERLIHVLVIHEDFKLFNHFHPEDFYVLTEEMFKSGSFPLTLNFPKDGRYLIAVDFRHQGHDIAFTKTVDIGERKAGQLEKDFSSKKKFDGYDVYLEVNPQKLVSETGAHIKYHFEIDGKPVTDMASYLGAPMHFAIISADLSSFAHTHGTLSADEPADQHHGWRALPEALAHGGLDDEPKEDSRQTQPIQEPSGAFGPDIFLHYTFPYPGIYTIFGEFKHNGQVVLTKFMVEVGVGSGGMQAGGHMH